MEREKFEQSWKDALDKAAVSPSDAVWTNIELELEKAKGGELKKRLFFYKALAAASIVFALAVGGAGYYFTNVTGPQAGNLALKTKTLTDPAVVKPEPAQQDGSAGTTIRESKMLAEASPSPATAKNQQAVEERGIPRKERALPPAFDTPHADNAATRFVQEEKDAHFTGSFPSNIVGTSSDDRASALATLPHHLKERGLPPLYDRREITLVLPGEDEKQAVDPVAAMLVRLEEREREIRGEQEKEEKSGSDENFWTSVGFAAGSFNSIASASPGGASSARSTAAMTLAAPIVDQETKASGYSYSMGVTVGTRLSDRWVLQGGVNYLTQATEYTADNVVLSPASSYQQSFHPATTNELIKSNELDLSNKIVYSAPYSVNNSMRYISIPMQAGYMLVQKTFGLQLNAGVATDLFLQNTIEANSAQIDKTTQGSGADSPYRAVNLSGLLGTEVSYRFNENYRISLNPGIRYPFNTIYKSELGVQSTPLTFDIGLRFRYIFH